MHQLSHPGISTKHVLWKCMSQTGEAKGVFWQFRLCRRSAWHCRTQPDCKLVNIFIDDPHTSNQCPIVFQCWTYLYPTLYVAALVAVAQAFWRWYCLFDSACLFLFDILLQFTAVPEKTARHLLPSLSAVNPRPRLISLCSTFLSGPLTSSSSSSPPSSAPSVSVPSPWSSMVTNAFRLMQEVGWYDASAIGECGSGSFGIQPNGIVSPNLRLQSVMPEKVQECKSPIAPSSSLLSVASLLESLFQTYPGSLLTLWTA